MEELKIQTFRPAFANTVLLAVPYYLFLRFNNQNYAMNLEKFNVELHTQKRILLSCRMNSKKTCAAFTQFLRRSCSIGAQELLNCCVGF